MTQGLQDRFAPHLKCFGCGPANELGLRIQSIPEGDEVVCRWSPADHHEAFPGVLGGGIIGTLLDCHSSWTAAWHLMRTRGIATPPSTVTADYQVRFLRPTPSKQPVTLRARVVEEQSDRAIVESELSSGCEITATCRGLFVAVKEGHPAYHRW